MSNKTLLLTGFEAFLGEKINSSALAVKEFSGKKINGVEIYTEILPVVHKKCVERTLELINKLDPVAVLNVGQAGGRTHITVEKVAINFLDYTIPDNEGNKPRYIKITEDGQDAYFATIPAEEIVEMIKKSNIPAMLSYSAGTFCCNELFYGVSHYIRKNNLKIANGFIHIPFIYEQAIDSPRPSMPLSTIIEGISIAIDVITKRV